MEYKYIDSKIKKSIALVAHDNMKQDLIEWCQAHTKRLEIHNLFATGTTGLLLEKHTNLQIRKLISGPIGGDQQVGALITQQEIDMLLFFWDPLEAQPHDPDVKALLRLAAVWNIPVACNQTSAEFIVHSDLFDSIYTRKVPDYDDYLAKRA